MSIGEVIAMIIAATGLYLQFKQDRREAKKIKPQD